MDITPNRQKRKVYSDASRPGMDKYPVEDVFDCLRSSTRWAPKALAYEVAGELVGTDQELFVTVLFVPTAIRTVYDYYPVDHPYREEHKTPEYEVEGWLLGDYPRKIWVVGALLNNSTDLIENTSFCLLEPGEEIGTAFNPLVAQ